jgi:hypothetical protein
MMASAIGGGRGEAVGLVPQSKSPEGNKGITTKEAYEKERDQSVQWRSRFTNTLESTMMPSMKMAKAQQPQKVKKIMKKKRKKMTCQQQWKAQLHGQQQLETVYEDPVEAKCKRDEEKQMKKEMRLQELEKKRLELQQQNQTLEEDNDRMQEEMAGLAAQMQAHQQAMVLNLNEFNKNMDRMMEEKFREQMEEWKRQLELKAMELDLAPREYNEDTELELIMRDSANDIGDDAVEEQIDKVAEETDAMPALPTKDSTITSLNEVNRMEMEIADLRETLIQLDSARQKLKEDIQDIENWLSRGKDSDMLQILNDLRVELKNLHEVRHELIEELEDLEETHELSSLLLMEDQHAQIRQTGYEDCLEGEDDPLQSTPDDYNNDGKIAENIRIFELATPMDLSTTAAGPVPRSSSSEGTMEIDMTEEDEVTCNGKDIDKDETYKLKQHSIDLEQEEPMTALSPNQASISEDEDNASVDEDDEDWDTMYTAYIQRLMTEEGLIEAVTTDSEQYKMMQHARDLKRMVRQGARVEAILDYLQQVTGTEFEIGSEADSERSEDKSDEDADNEDKVTRLWEKLEPVIPEGMVIKTLLEDIPKDWLAMYLDREDWLAMYLDSDGSTNACNSAGDVDVYDSEECTNEELELDPEASSLARAALAMLSDLRDHSTVQAKDEEDELKRRAVDLKDEMVDMWELLSIMDTDRQIFLQEINKGEMLAAEPVEMTKARHKLITEIQHKSEELDLTNHLIAQAPSVKYRATLIEEIEDGHRTQTRTTMIQFQARVRGFLTRRKQQAKASSPAKKVSFTLLQTEFHTDGSYHIVYGRKPTMTGKQYRDPKARHRHRISTQNRQARAQRGVEEMEYRLQLKLAWREGTLKLEKRRIAHYEAAQHREQEHHRQMRQSREKADRQHQSARQSNRTRKEKFKPQQRHTQMSNELPQQQPTPKKSRVVAAEGPEQPQASSAPTLGPKGTAPAHRKAVRKKVKQVTQHPQVQIRCTTQCAAIHRKALRQQPFRTTTKQEGSLHSSTSSYSPLFVRTNNKPQQQRSQAVFQHHAWISPTHRKALRQQPFIL